MNRILIFLFTALTAIIVKAQTHGDESEVLRPVVTAYTVETGGCHIADTYLSPLRYSGWTAAFAYERMQAMKFDPERWIMGMKAEVGIEHTDNPAGNATIWGAGATFKWGMMRRIMAPGPVKIAAGGSTSLNLGALYTSRNGNNPVAAKASWTVNATAMASWATRIKNLPVVIRWQPILPLTGIFFSQDYGELYYEIYLGNRSNLVHGAWPGNYFALDNLITADFRFGATALRVGYHSSVLSTKINNITTRLITNSFVIGISGEWLSLSPGKRQSADARIISALY